MVAVLPERTADGRIIVGRNYDYFHDVSKEGAAIYRTYPQDGNASLGCCDIWVGREDGLNDAGLFVGMAAIFVPWLQPGLVFWFIVRMALERCANRGGRRGADQLAAPCRQLDLPAGRFQR